MYGRKLKGKELRAAAVGLGLLFSLVSAAQDAGSWRAASATAKSVTGDVGISDQKLAINYASFTIARIRPLQPAEVRAVFDLDSSVNASGALYRLLIPAGQRFQHHNTMCGNDDTQWMASAVVDGRLHLAFFSGATMPSFTLDAILNGTNLCGTYSYER